MAGRSKPGRRRRIYQLVNPITMAIEGAAITPMDKINKLRAMELSTIETFVSGTANDFMWHQIESMMLVSASMAQANIGPEALDACHRCRQALDSVRTRYDRTGKWGVSADELQAFRDVYSYIDLQRQSIDRRTFETHIRKATNMAMSGVSQVG